MFYYLHLTRPPLEQADPLQPLLITPNIANDLRTEYPSPGPGGIDIFYAWVKCIEPASLSESGLEDAALTKSPRNGHTLGPMTAPQKVTAWTENTYKEVHVFPPKEALNGTGRWQLLLCTRPAELGTFVPSIDLSPSAGKFGKYVLPILSSPVHFVPGSRNNNTIARRGAEKKQVRNERVFKFPSSLWGTTMSGVGPLRITEHLSYDLDKKVWDSGVGLSHWLVSIAMAMAMAGTPNSESGLPSVVHNLMHGKDATILELGAGTGLVSLVLSTLLSHCPEQAGVQIVATDLESAMEVLETNISNNSHCYTSVGLKAAVLDWDDDDTFPEEVRDGVDFIIMADVTYNTSSFPSLIRTLSQLSRLRSPPPAVLLAYKERDPDERRLWGMAQEVGLRLQEIARVPGAGGMPIEIFAGTFDSENSGKDV